MAVRSTRGIPTLESLCTREGAHAGFRLRGEYLPGAAPFPETPEETAWLALRETLLVAVLEVPAGFRVLRSWTRGSAESSDRVDLPRDQLAGFPDAAGAGGVWSLAAFAEIASGPGHLEFEHDAYAYQEEGSDSDEASLDLHAWSPPRRFRIERSRRGGDLAATRALLAIYAPLLPNALDAGSAFAPAFDRRA